MLKLKQLLCFGGILGLLCSAYGNPEVTSFRFNKSADGYGGKAKLLTPNAQLIFQEDGVLVGGKGGTLKFSFPGWKGREGTLAYKIKPLNWQGNGKKFVIFARALDTVKGSFEVYKYGPSNGIFVLGCKKTAGQKPLLSFPVYDKKLLKKWRRNQWHQLAFTWSKGNFVKLYLDGKLTASGNGSFGGPQSFTSIGIGPSKNGAGHDSESLIKDVAISPRVMTDTEIALLHAKPAISGKSIVPLAPVVAAPIQDGNINPDEYSTELTGLIDNKNFCLSTNPAKVYTACDEKNIYLAASIKLPPNYKLKSLVTENDDFQLVATRDIFVLFLSHQSGIEPQRRSGLYFTIAPNGATFDAQETVDWKQKSCQRDAKVDYGIKRKSKISGRIWTVELAIPRNKLNFTATKTFHMSLGFKLGTTRLSLSPQLVWYDHYQGGSEVLFSNIGVRQQYASLSSGKIHGRMVVTAKKKQKLELQINVTRPQISRKSEGMVLEKYINEKLSITGSNVVWQKNKAMQIKSSKEQSMPFEYQLKTPDVYLLGTQLRSADKIIFNREIMFNYFPALSLTLNAIPSSDQIQATYQCRFDQQKLKGANLKLKFKLNSKNQLTQVISQNLQNGKYTFSMKKLQPGQYEVKADLIGKNGQLLSTGFFPFKKLALEAWRREKVGQQALEPGWLPSPWTAITLEDSYCLVWGRKYDYSSGLLNQITSQGRNLLHKPIMIKYQLAGESKVRELNRTGMTFKQIGKGKTLVIQTFKDKYFSLKVQHTLEFDGFNLIQSSLQGHPQIKLKKLWVDIPFKNMKYQQINEAGFETVGKIKSASFKSFPIIWLGDDKVNCSILAESCRGWFIDSRYPRVKLEHKGNVSTVRLLIVNTPGTLKQKLGFSWIIQAGPTKKLFDGWQDIRMMGGAWTPPPTNMVMMDPRQWSSSYSYPKPLNWKRMSSMVNYIHKHGQKLYPYITPTTISSYDIIRRNTPIYTFPPTQIPKSAYVDKRVDSKPKEEYFYNARDWNIVPHKATGDGSGKETTELSYNDPDSSWSDYFVYSIREMLVKTDVDGFYFDLALPAINFNPQKKLSYKTRDNVEEGTYQWLAMRKIYKRLYYIFDKHRTPARKPYILGHGTRYIYPINSFVDVEFHGESLKPKRPFEFTQWALQDELVGTPIILPPKKNAPASYDAVAYRTYFGSFYGTPIMLLPQYGYVPELGRNPKMAREILSFTFLHNTLLWPAYIKASVIFKFWKKVNIPFDMKNVIFKGYWENGIKGIPDCIKVSYYRQANSEDYLLVISNFSNQEVMAQVVLPQALNQLRRGTNQETGQKIAIDKTISIKVPAHDLQVIRLN